MIEKKSLQTAWNALADGKIIAVATDTVPGLAVDSGNRQGIDSLYALKGRNFQKPLVWMVPDLDKVKEIAHIDEWVTPLLKENWPGALTVIFKAKKHIGKDTIGIRIPEQKGLLALLTGWKNPLAVTSANESGKKNLLSMMDISRVFGDKIAWYWPQVKNEIMHSYNPSTIIDVSAGELKIIRQGELIL